MEIDLPLLASVVPEKWNAEKVDRRWNGRETEYHYVAARNASGQKTKVHEQDDNNLPGPTTKRRARVKYEILNGRTGTSGRCLSLQHVAALEMVDSRGEGLL